MQRQLVEIGGARARTLSSRAPREVAPAPGPDPGLRRARRIAAASVALLAFLALALRLPGIGFMLPHLPHIDERVYLTQIETLRGSGSDAFEWRNFRYYPHLVAHLVAQLPGPRTEVVPEAPLAEHLAVAAAPLVEIRFWVALLSIGIVPGTYLLARRFLARPAAVFAAALAATSILDQWYAQQARPHAVVAVVGLAAVLAALELRRRGDLRSYLLAGTVAGLAIATLQNLVLVLAALFAAHFARGRTATRRPRLALAAALAIAGALGSLFYPYALDQHGQGPQPVGSQVMLYGHGVDLGEFNGRGLATLLSPWRDYDPLVCLLLVAALGLAALFAVRAGIGRLRARRAGLSAVPPGARAAGGARTWLRRHGDHAVVLAYVLSYVAVLAIYQRTYQRFSLPLLPYVACFASWGLFRAGELVPGITVSARRKLVISSAVFLFLMQTVLAARMTMVRRAPDTATLAARWIESHLSAADRVALLPPLDLPLARTPDALDTYYRRNGGRIDLWPHWQREHAGAITPAFDLRTMPMHTEEEVKLLRDDPRAYLASLDADYAVLEVNEDHRRPTFTSLIAAARAAYPLVARITPWRDPRRQDDPILYYWDSELSPDRDLVLRALGMKALGPPIEVYRLRERAP